MLDIARKAMADLGMQLLDGGDNPFEEIVAMISPDTDAETIATASRLHIGQNLEEIDNQYQEVVAAIASNAAACSGTLDMRAARDDVTYTVYTCTSPGNYALNGTNPDQLPMQVRATTD